VVGAADPQRPDGGYPASHPGVIAVARSGEKHTLVPAAVVAPGTDVPTSLPGARWGMVSGSSFAAAHVAGLAALLEELQPRAGPQELRRRLDDAVAGDGALSVASAGPPGSIDACAALARAANACICLCSAGSTATAAYSR
jgi:subtilisin family serine protease